MRQIDVTCQREVSGVVVVDVSEAQWSGSWSAVQLCIMRMYTSGALKRTLDDANARSRSSQDELIG